MTTACLCFYYDNFAATAKNRVIVFAKNGKVTWFINSICYGENKKPDAVIAHFEVLLPIEWHIHKTLRDWLRVACG